MLERTIFPLTVCFKDNKLKYVKPGQLFDTQLEPIFEDLKEFGDNPLSDAEIAEHAPRCREAPSGRRGGEVPRGGR